MNYLDSSGLGAEVNNNINTASTIVSTVVEPASNVNTGAGVVGTATSIYQLVNTYQTNPTTANLIHDWVMLGVSGAGFVPAAAPYALALSWVDIGSQWAFGLYFDITYGNITFTYDMPSPSGTTAAWSFQQQSGYTSGAEMTMSGQPMYK